MFPAVWHAVTGCQVKRITAVLTGAATRQIPGEPYPGLVSESGGKCPGVVYHDVPPEAMALLDTFEGSEYQRRSVQVRLENGESLAAEVYFTAPDFLIRLGEIPWSAEDFARDHLTKFLAMIRGREEERVALFGGTFDPPHSGHLAIARAAMEQANLDRVVFLPCRQSPHKSAEPGATGEQRTEMLQLALEDAPWAEVSGWELAQPGPSYSWQTAQHFAAAWPEARLYWLMGEDQWEQLPRWSRPEILADLLTFIVFPRSGQKPQRRPGMRARFLRGEFPGSSTEVRRVAAVGGKLADLVPDAVADYIARHGLYSAVRP